LKSGQVAAASTGAVKPATTTGKLASTQSSGVATIHRGTGTPRQQTVQGNGTSQVIAAQSLHPLVFAASLGNSGALMHSMAHFGAAHHAFASHGTSHVNVAGRHR
jgi:hypothetical protein